MHSKFFATVTRVSKLMLVLAVAGVMTLAVGCSSQAKYASIENYAAEYAKGGYVTFLDDGRVWVFAEGSEGLEEFLTKGEPAKNAMRIGAGPDGRTIKSVDLETIDAYLAAK